MVFHINLQYIGNNDNTLCLTFDDPHGDLVNSILKVLNKVKVEHFNAVRESKKIYVLTQFLKR